MTSDKSLLGGRASLHEWVLVDADALVALAKEDDSNHNKAVDICKILQKKGVSYLVSPFAVAEAVTVISYKVSQKAAISFLEETRTIDNLSEVSLPEQHAPLADAWFIKQKKKGTSYFDCYNMALLERYKAYKIFSFDKVYESNGFLSAAKTN